MFLLVTVATFLAVFTQALAGFGFGLVAMPMLVALLGLEVAAPLGAVLAFTCQSILLARFIKDISFKSASRLIVASLVGIPIGIVALARVDAAIITRALGILIVVYALYALLTPAMPEIKNPALIFAGGFFGGILHGAYNTGGPPVVVAGDCARWKPAEFKSNLQGFFVVSSTTVIISHIVGGNFSSEVFSNLLWALPGVALGIYLGLKLDTRIDPAMFRRIVLALLLVLGGALILGVG